MQRLHTGTPLDRMGEGMWQALRTGRSAVRKISRATMSAQHLPIVVLAYHRVTSLVQDPFKLIVPPARFREQLAFIKDSLPVLRFEDDWSKVRRPSVVVTFDDGYADNFYEALPILEELGIPATFFVATGNIGTPREFWWDELERLALSKGGAGKPFTLRQPKGDRTWPTSTGEERLTMYFDLHRVFKNGNAYLRRSWLTQLRAWSGEPATPRASHRTMTVNELRALASSPLVTIGGHTDTHPSLARLGKSLQRAEIYQGKLALEAWIEKPVEVFSYPFGGPADISPVSVELCKEAGFKKAATCTSGLMFRWTDPFRIPRLMAVDTDIRTFAGRMSDFFQIGRLSA